MLSTKRIVPSLWFDGRAEEAANYYTEIFDDSKILRTTYYPNTGQDIHKQPAGSVMTVEFELEGQKFLALNGGPEFKFTEAVSFIVYCESQQEIDYFWDKLSAGGDPKAQQCGWLKDKFGVSWQVTPSILDEMMADKDKEKVARVMDAFMPMKKLDLAELKEAYSGKRKLATGE